MGRLKIGKVRQVTFATDGSLHADEIGEGADRGFDAIDLADLGPSQEPVEPGRCQFLCDEVQVSVGGGQVNAAIPRDSAGGDGGAIGTGGLPPSDQRADPLYVLGVGIENRIDVARCADDAMADQGNATDEDVANSSLIEVVEDAAEAGH